MAISVVMGDITRVPVSTIITPVNSYGEWWGGVDMAIYEVAGQAYHEPLREMLEKDGLSDGQVRFVQGRRKDHKGAFDHVIFVVDDLKRPLRHIIMAGLAFGLKSPAVTSMAVPIMRTGVMLGKIEKSEEQVSREMQKAVEYYVRDGGKKDVTIVVYKNPHAYQLVSEWAHRI